MIYTRFGNKARIISGNIEKNEVDIIVTYPSKVKLYKTFIHELKADNGIEEIHQAIIKANTEKQEYIEGGPKDEKN